MLGTYEGTTQSNDPPASTNMGSPGQAAIERPTVGACVVATLALLVAACGPEYVDNDLDAAMQKETGPDVSGEACGNGLIDTVYGETCDGENFGGATCHSFGSPDGALICTSRCGIDTALCIGQDLCGNGLVEGDERCDDGPGNEACRYGVESCEVCLPDCTLGAGDPSYCGDGVHDRPYERCDGAELAGATCTSRGFRGGDLSCGQYCHFDTSGCDRSYCGDGIVQSDYEVCDTALTPDRACADGEETVEICVRCQFLETRPCVPVDAGSTPGDASLDDASSSADDAGMAGTDASAPDDTGGSDGSDGSGGTIEDASSTVDDASSTPEEAGGIIDSSDSDDRSRAESGCAATPARGGAYILWLAAAATAAVRRRRSS